MWHLTEFYVLWPWGILGIVIVIVIMSIVVVVVVVNNYNYCNCQYLIQENSLSMYSFNVAIIDYSVIYN